MSKKKNDLFLSLERLGDPSTILWRSIEAGVVKKELEKVLKKEDRVLDLGCGEGIVAKVVFGKREVGWGVDNDKEMVRRARRSRVYKEVFLADGGDIPLRLGSVDLVFSNSVLEHIERLGRVLGECRRILKRGGYLVFTVPSDNLKRYSMFSRVGWRWGAKIYGQWRERKFEHYNSYSLKKWKEVLGRYDFEVEKASYFLDKKTV